jgi:uncharacterized protein (DUF362 family)
MDRREFLKAAAATAVAATLNPRRLFAEESPRAVRVVVVHGTDAARMLSAGIESLGGWQAFVRPGGKTTLKINAAWAATPEQGANTTPALVAAAIRACRTAGAGAIVLPENPCSPAEKSFQMSGIGAAAQRAGGRLYEPQAGRDYVTLELSRGQLLRQVSVVRDVIETDCLINMPVAKTHNGATLTIGMKNWMGSVRDRGHWHRTGLHQCIADFNPAVRAHVTIVDATRIMITNGPRGPGKLEHPNQLICGTDPVAVDAYAATLFRLQPFDIPYIQLAHDLGIGCGKLADVDVQHLTA